MINYLYSHLTVNHPYSIINYRKDMLMNYNIRKVDEYLQRMREGERHKSQYIHIKKRRKKKGENDD
jgi:hypothetical protein